MAAYQGAAAFKRINEIIDQEIKIKEVAKSPKLFLENTNIKFDNVGFKYENTEKKAIKSINFNIKGNTMVAFVGHSGAGKSTIINLLQDFMIPKKEKLKLTVKI